MVLLRFVVFLILICTSLVHSDFHYDYSDYPNYDECDPEVCNAPNCNCFGNDPSEKYGTRSIPQFVMLTFDDAITISNIKTYLDIQGSRRNKGNGCPITMTFFVTHEYNDYNLTNLLYRNGHEMAVHSISHITDTDFWKTASKSRWEAEINGMKEFLETYALIPNSTITGQRAPFLQTAGDTTFEMLKEKGFLYDSSMPSRLHREPPLWPYTMDHGFPQDCQIQPCPTKSYPGLWIVPMVQLKRTGGQVPFFCSMVDACTPYPTTVADTKKFLMENFDRHYYSNKAPFPVFLHEAWLQDRNRLRGYLSFIDELLKKDDVFFVSVREVVEYMKKPTTTEKYAQQPCFSNERPRPGDCSNAVTCEYKVRNRFMKSCVPCPRRYPWITNA